MIASQIAFLSLAISPAPADSPMGNAATAGAQGLVMPQPAPSAGESAAVVPAAALASAAAAPSSPAPSAPPVASAPSAAALPASAPDAPPASPDAAGTTPADTAPEPDLVAQPKDPFEKFNRASYAISQPFDRYLLRPVAMLYKHVVPHILRDGVRNFLANLINPVIFVNDVLQLRPKRALHTTERFLLNTGLGIGGVFDVAKRHPFGIRAHPNGFGDTLGYYGVRPGPYIYLPIVGPANPRDIAGYFGDWFAEPRLLNRVLNPDKDKPIIRSKLVLGRNSMVTMIVGGVDQRAQNDDALKAITSQSVDPYAALRSSYVQNRAGEIAALKAPDGTAPNSAALDDPLRDPAEKTNSSPQLGAPVPR